MKLHTWVLVLVAAVAAPLILVQGYQLTIIERLASDGERWAGREMELTRRLTDVSSAVDQLVRLEEKARVLADPRYRAEALRHRRWIGAELTELVLLHHGTGSEALIRELRDDWHRGPNAAPADFARRLERMLVGQRQRLQRYLDSNRAATAQARSTARLGFWTAVAGLAVGTALLARTFVRPLAGLQQVAGRLSAGRYDVLPLVASPHREIAQLSVTLASLGRRLACLESRRSRSLSSVSHDIKGPLAGLEESQRALLEGLAGPLGERQRRLLRLSLDSSARLRRLSERLLTFDHLQSKGGAPDSSCCVWQVLAESAAAVGGLQSAEAPEVVLEPPEGALESLVRGDPVQLGQLFDNLIANACRHAGDSARIRVRMRRWGRHPRLPEWVPAADSRVGWWVIEVADRGPGIDEALKPQLFLPWVAASPAGGGHGLGLAICRAVVQVHSGRIWAEDRAGGGTVFRVSLPAAGRPAREAVA